MKLTSLRTYTTAIILLLSCLFITTANADDNKKKEEKKEKKLSLPAPVSYTHLTLPTILLV